MTTVRVWFTKVGESAYISLLDLQRVMQRAMKRSKLPVWYTLGFNPHIYMTFSAPLSLGQESLAESLDFRTEVEIDYENAAKLLSDCLPKGIDVVRMETAKMDPNQIAFSKHEVQYSAEHAAAAKQAFAEYAALDSALVVKKGKKGTQKTIDLKQFIEIVSSTETENGFVVTLLCPAGSTLNVNPMLLLSFLQEKTGLLPASGRLLRMEMLTKNKEKFV